MARWRRPRARVEGDPAEALLLVLLAQLRGDLRYAGLDQARQKCLQRSSKRPEVSSTLLKATPSLAQSLRSRRFFLGPEALWGLPCTTPSRARDLVVAALAAAHADHLRRGRGGRRDLELHVLQVHAVVRELELDHLQSRSRVRDEASFHER